MSGLCNPTIIVAVATFLWYRKGRLWNFYDSILSESLEQMKQNSLNSKRWEQIALKHRDLLSKETFQSLFRFELDYLYQKILDASGKLWIPDAGTTYHETEIVDIEYYNKEQYCKNVIKEQFLSEFRFCGVGLFYHALKRHIHKKEDTDKGYKEERRGRSPKE